MAKGKPRLSVKQRSSLRDICADLANYLNQDLDPWDFEWLRDLYVESEGLDPGTSFDEIVEMPDFVKFAKRKIASGQMQPDVYDPAYLLFEGAEVMPPGQWYAHFSPEEFSRFDRGITLDALSLSTYVKKKAMVDCKTNLRPDEVGLFEIVWGFAIGVGSPSDDNDAIQTARSYGRHFILFQTDFAVMAYHSGDNQWQIIFPLCTEYNVHVGNRSGGGWFLQDRDPEFERFSDVVRAAERR